MVRIELSARKFYDSFKHKRESYHKVEQSECLFRPAIYISQFTYVADGTGDY